jgi:LysM repeat protein
VERSTSRTEITREREISLPAERIIAPERTRESAPQKQLEQAPRQSKDSTPDSGLPNQPRYPAASLFQAGEQMMNRDLPPFWQTRSSRLRSESTGENFTTLGQRAELVKNPDGLSAIAGLKNDPVIKEIILGVKPQSGEIGTNKESDVVKIASSRGDHADPNRSDRVRSGDLIATAGGRNPDAAKAGETTSQANGVRADQAKGGDGTGIVSGNKLDPRLTDSTNQANMPPNSVRGSYTEIAGLKDTEPVPGRRGEAVATVSEELSGKDVKHVPVKGSWEGDGVGVTIPDSGLATIFATAPSGDEKDGADRKNDDKAAKKEPERRQKYVVKKGDTLESIALKMLRNVKLNLLLFEINRNLIPVRILNGRLLLELRPKLVIFLPTSKEIQEFCGRPGSGNFRKFDYSASQDSEEESEEEQKRFPVIPNRTVRRQSNRNSKQTIIEPLSPTIPQSCPDRELFLVPTAETVRESVLNVKDNARVVKSTEGELTCFRLEICQDELWSPVISYETSETSSVRHEYQSDGRKKTIKIDLPSFAVRELAENDLLSNWSEYCRGFVCAH